MSGRSRGRSRSTAMTPGRASVLFFWHQLDLPKCQVYRGNAAKYLNGHFGGPFVCFLHFAPKTSKRTIDDPHELAFAHLMMFSHTTIRFSCGLRLPGTGERDSIISARERAERPSWRDTTSFLVAQFEFRGRALESGFDRRCRRPTSATITSRRSADIRISTPRARPSPPPFGAARGAIF